MPRFQEQEPEGLRRILVLSGPNLNMLGRREPEVYGTMTLSQLEQQVGQYAMSLPDDPPLEVSFFQNNGEGVLIDTMQNVRVRQHGIILNAGAYAHYSYALRDCIVGLDIPVVNVHLTDIYNREEEWRHTDVLADVCLDSFVGMGVEGYFRAVDRLREYFIENPEVDCW